MLPEFQSVEEDRARQKHDGSEKTHRHRWFAMPPDDVEQRQHGEEADEWQQVGATQSESGDRDRRQHREQRRLERVRVIAVDLEKPVHVRHPPSADRRKGDVKRMVRMRDCVASGDQLGARVAAIKSCGRQGHCQRRQNDCAKRDRRPYDPTFTSLARR